MVKVFVTGIGLKCASGSLDESWQRILRQETAIQMTHPFKQLPPYPLALVEQKPSDLGCLLKIALGNALKDAKLFIPLSDVPVVVGSSRSYQFRWEHFLAQAITTPWLESLPYQASRLVAQWIQTEGIVLSPMSACATGIWSIFQGYELIQQGYCEQVIVGAVETPITPLTLAGFQKMGALASTGCYPFDKNREGLVLGEGAVILVLESEKSVKTRSVTPYGEILGFGLTCDGEHLSAPSQDNYYAAIALKQCLERSRLTPQDVDLIHAHGTSTHLNDRREANLIQGFFPSNVAVTSTKGATGHTLGASGAIGVALSLLALRSQQLIPCVGLNRPDFDLNFVTKAVSYPLNAILCFSFGFGGQNAIVCLGKI